VRILNWNCNMSFGRKRDLVTALRPDLLILQEVSRRDLDETHARFRHWVGKSPHKGLAILGFADHDYQLDDRFTEDLPWFIPLRVADLDLQILAIWASVKTTQLRYVRVIHAALDHYDAFIRAAPTILIGDFNSNSFWDKKHGQLDHTHLVARLDELGLRSVYHHQRGEPHGGEREPTWYLYRHRTRGYHIDFAFVPDALLPHASLTIGEPDAWLPHSDHMPFTLDLAPGALGSAASRSI
jgi:endonuclease/exonuclease/phosphatase family metal-dependent hydrolase